MKILQIITRLIQGGAQRVVVDTCAHMTRRGHEVHLAYGPIYGPEGSLLDDARASGATLHEVPTLVRPVAPLTDWRGYRALRRLIRELTPDVVHTHSSKAGVLGRAAAWRQRVPLVLHTVHGLPFHEHQPPLVHQLYVHLERFAARRCHHLIAVSPAMADAFVEKRIAPRDRFTVIHAGIDLERFAADRTQGPAVRDTLGIPADRCVVGIVARLDPLKGHLDLIDAAAQLPAVHLLCIGDGWDRSRIEAEAQRRLAGRVTFTGLVSPDEVARLLTCVDVCALPSYQEGQGLTLAEALLAGCAIVGYDVGGIGAVCIEGETGRLVPRGDVRALSDTITWILQHPDEAAELTRRGQQHVREHFSVEQMAGKIERLYLELMQRKHHTEITEKQRRRDETS